MLSGIVSSHNVDNVVNISKLFALMLVDVGKVSVKKYLLSISLGVQITQNRPTKNEVSVVVFGCYWKKPKE